MGDVDEAVAEQAAGWETGPGTGPPRWEGRQVEVGAIAAGSYLACVAALFVLAPAGLAVLVGLTVLVLIHEGYHPFVAAYGYDAYYLNTLAGSARSMAATDDPQYAHLRNAWPEPDPRVPLVQRPD